MHAADAHDDPKLMRLLEREKHIGDSLFWWTNEYLRREGTIALSDASVYAKRMLTTKKKLSSVWDTCIELGLYVLEGDRFYAPCQRRDVEEFERKRDASRERMRNVRERYANVARTPEEEQEQEEDEAEDEEQDEVNSPAVSPPAPVVAKPKPAFNPEGKTKYLDWVFLSADQYKRVVRYYEEKGLDYNDFKEAVRELDRWFGDNPKKRLKRTDDAKALMGWPLDRALQRRREILNTQAAERRLKEQAT